MVRATPKPSIPKPAAEKSTSEVDEIEQAREDAVAEVLKNNLDIAVELEGLTTGEKLIRLRQRGLIDFDVQ